MCCKQANYVVYILATTFQVSALNKEYRIHLNHGKPHPCSTLNVFVSVSAGNSPLCRRITSRSLAFAAQKRALICLSQKGFGSNTAKPKVHFRSSGNIHPLRLLDLQNILLWVLVSSGVDAV